MGKQRKGLVMADLKWLQLPKATILAKAWATSYAKYPNADKSKFIAQTDFDDKHKATAEIYFKVGPGDWKSIFGSDSKYWSP